LRIADFFKEKGGDGMANRQRRVDRMKVKEMVEGWDGRKLPKNVSFKTLIEMVVDEAVLTRREEDDYADETFDERA
jgi:hypothetical protein